MYLFIVPNWLQSFYDYYMFEFPCIISWHQLGSMFNSNCNNAVHVSDAFCVHPQEHLETVVAASGV